MSAQAHTLIQYLYIIETRMLENRNKNTANETERTNQQRKKLTKEKETKKFINKYLAKISGENESKILHYDDFSHQYSSKTWLSNTTTKNLRAHLDVEANAMFDQIETVMCVSSRPT